MDPTPNKIFIEESDTGRRVEVTFTDAAAPGVKKMLEGWFGPGKVVFSESVPAAALVHNGTVAVAEASPAVRAPDVCPGCWRPVPTPHERDGVRLCDQEATEIDSLRQFGTGTENAKLALRKLENYRTAALRSGIRWEAPVGV